MKRLKQLKQMKQMKQTKIHNKKMFNKYNMK